MVNTDERILYLTGEITEENISEICFNILYLSTLDDVDEAITKDFLRRPINLYIQSNGGNIPDAWALIDIIQNLKTPIYTHACGYVHSAALIIYLAGHKRFCRPALNLLIPQYLLHKNWKISRFSGRPQRNGLYPSRNRRFCNRKYINLKG